MPNPSFKRTPLAAGVALALGVAVPAYAQEEDMDDLENQVIEEIITTGIRSSLQSAQSMKENADTFVDGVTASDIGALPDRSVAEALQRVPGVNIGRFKKSTDPDRFSVEGADVIIRGLPFVRSELNGRDVFSATGGTVLSFNDVSPELLGGVLVYKNATASMIDGGIAGTVDLQTRKPLDTNGMRFAASTEYNYGDIAEDGSPTASFLGSNSWETDGGRFGIQLGYAQSKLNTRSNASQVTDPCYRDPAAFDTTGCIRAANLDSNNVLDQNFDATNFPAPGSVVVPKGAGVRTTGYERDRNALSLVGQWESPSGELLVTAEYLRAEADLFVDENAMLALVNNDGEFPIPVAGQPWEFDSNGMFQRGLLSYQNGRGPADCPPGSLDSVTGQPCHSTTGIPTEMLRFQREDNASTEDVSLDISWQPNDQLSVNFELQQVDSDRSEDGVISVMQTFSDIYLDMTGDTPDVQFRTPATTDGSSDAEYFTNGDRSIYWFLIDSQIENEGEMTTAAADLDYYLGEDLFIKEIKFGARWSDRNRVTRDNRFGNWGLLSAPWAGGGVFAGATGVSNFSEVRNPFADFQRGEVSTPTPGGAAIYFGGNNLLDEYFSGTTEQQNDAIQALSPVAAWGDPNPWGPVYNRTGLEDGPFLPGEISDVTEITEAVYLQADFEFDTAWPISGNIGVRYVETTIESDGELQFPLGPPPDGTLCSGVTGSIPGYCLLSPAREAEFQAAFTGEILADDADITYSHVLPSLNVKMQVTDDFLIRAAASKGISRPDLAAYATGGLIGDNTNSLRDSGTLETGPLFAISTGNRLVRPVEAWSYDLSAEWYFSGVGSLTFSMFWKEFDKLITQGVTVRDLVSPTNAVAETRITGPSNVDDGSLQGFELGYQQTFDFLPAPFNNLGAQATYTYIDGDDLTGPVDQTQRSPFADGLGFPGISEDTVNLVAFYEDDIWSARLAYNWRSEFLITPRDDIFPFSPIIGNDTGQLDGSVFYNFNNFGNFENIKVGLQAVNLLDEVTQTSQIIDFDGTQVRRSSFRNDRRYTLAVRFTF